MPRLRRRAKQRRGYSTHDVFALCVGYDFFRKLSFDLSNGPEARAAWRALRDEVMALCERRRRVEHRDQLMPWAWWQFDAPEPRNEDEAEAAQLRRLGIVVQ